MEAATHARAHAQDLPVHDFVITTFPPCQQDCAATTMSGRSLDKQLAEAKVLITAAINVHRCMGMRSLAMVVENPGTGKLVGRKMGGRL
eukprot:352575-Chlamydomonas_euryale.AAC.2